MNIGHESIHVKYYLNLTFNNLQHKSGSAGRV